MDSQTGGEVVANSAATAVVGRLAPSPTGALHLGNARSFLLAWLSVRQQAGTLLLRIEDIDSPRVKSWAIQSTIDDLKWLGLDWDYGPDQGADVFHAPLIQTQRMERYQAVLTQLREQHCLYPCTCTRSEIAEAASAPHESQLEGPVYPGTCRLDSLGERVSQTLTVPPVDANFAWRWAFDDAPQTWTDCVRGTVTAHPASQLGDFVIAKGNGTPAYQLAVVIDDHDMGVTEVVRGDDLVFSTFRQLAILKQLGWTAPRYAHVPLIVGPDGRRLAKRHGDTRIATLRTLGITPEAIVGYLAWSVGLLQELMPLHPNELLGCLTWQSIVSQPTVFDLSRELPILRRLKRGGKRPALGDVDGV
ncbi:tRNA glutamyl-Q(34) synthetase GluQRS [Aureliella helgolandensis]|uniref:Glutamyl-Q tRNA(Asp) synthetase n=1 Tax=Aureliella helgolandensis TaxID=2527968 RepID=A0A518G8K3_9BACT|nr:tRNA glutamyl-Q(34) synthetase GluQRS [Aureliella helgolandensis]QDV24911.1 Glutamate--tRNA ligase [Aureliella helgolandensis]